MPHIRLHSYSHFIALKKKHENHSLTWSFFFCCKSCFNQNLKRSRCNDSSSSKPIPKLKKCCFQIKRYYINFKGNVHMTCVSRSAKGHKNTSLCTKSRHYCHFRPHVFHLLFDYSMHLALTAMCTIFSLIA